MVSYGQFCTVARGAEVFGERWTPLVVRELLCGSTRFNDIRRGVPRMSTTLLAQRLRKLEEIGVVERVKSRSGAEYRLTAAGEELRPIVMALGHWGARWIGSRLKREELDAGFLMWDIRRFVQHELLPAQRRIVVHFQFSDARRGEGSWWLVIENGEADLCRDDPGHEVTLIVESTVRALTEIWTGDLLPEQALRRGDVRVLGRAGDARNLWKWIGGSAFRPTRRAVLARQARSSADASHRDALRAPGA
jgi:DNA-binding HxlR family transcriptional regulator